MRVLIDTDVLLDHLLEREPFARAASRLLELNAQGKFDAYVSGITPINLFYIARKVIGRDKVIQFIRDLLLAVQICSINQAVLSHALTLAFFSDYEDAVQHASATESHLDAIVTRNLDDYKNATLPVFSPADFLNQLNSQNP